MNDITNIRRENMQKLTDIQRKIVQDNIGLVYNYVYKHWYSNKEIQEDLISEGIFGLCRASQLYDESKHVEFSTYATIWIKSSVNRYYKYKESQFKVTEESYKDARMENVLRFGVPLFGEDNLDFMLEDTIADKNNYFEIFENEYDTNIIIKNVFKCLTKEEYSFMINYITSKKTKADWKDYRKFQNLSRKVRMFNKDFKL